MKKKWKRIVSFSLAVLMTISSVAVGMPVNAVAAPAPADSGFVTTNGTKFSLDGSDFYYAGTNNYYINFKPSEDVDEVMKDAQEMGLSVIRTWGNIDVGVMTDEKDEDGYPVFTNNADSDNSIGHKEGVYYQYFDAEKKRPVVNEGEYGLRKLDYAIASAQQHNIKLLITFTNYWYQFGGMDQYIAWAKLAGESVSGREDFYTNAKIKQWFKNYISTLLNHKNYYTGVKYKDDPTIFAWELANEPRCNVQGLSDTTQSPLYKWVEEMSAYVKSEDKHHMVAVGDEGGLKYKDAVEAKAAGFTSMDWMTMGGSMGDFAKLMQIDTIDFATPHIYLSDWGLSGSDAKNWLKVHAELAHKAGKPIILEEFGWKSGDVGAFKTRDAYFNTVYDIVEGKTYEGVSYEGSNYWMIASHTLNDATGYYPDYDGYTVYGFSGMPTDSTRELIMKNATVMNNKGEKNRISDTSLSYDKAHPTTCKTTVTPQSGSEISAVVMNGQTLTKGTDYTVNSNVITFADSYLNALEERTYYATVDMSVGMSLQIAIKVTDSSINSAVVADGAYVFDKNVNVSKDVRIPVSVNDGEALKGVYVVGSGNKTTAMDTSAYTSDTESVTIFANYLKDLSVGALQIMLDYTKGTDPTVTITIKDTTGKDVVDDFESYADGAAVSTAWAANPNGDTPSLSVVTGKSSSKALDFQYDISDKGYAGITKSASGLAVTSFDGISFWVQAENTANKNITIQLREPVDQNNSIYWEKILTWADLDAASGKTIQIPFKDFKPKKSEYNGIVQPAEGQICGQNGVTEFSIYVGGSEKTGTFYIDDIQLYSAGGSDITIVPVTDVRLDKAALSVEAGKTATLTATVEPATATYKTVNWTSDNTAVATVTNGTVKGIKEGTATITCTSAANAAIKAACTVTVTASQQESGDTVGTLAWSANFNPSKEWDEILGTDGKTKEFSVKAASTTVPVSGSKLQANIYLPTATAPSYAGDIKFCGIMRLGSDWHWVESKEIPALAASDFTKVGEKNCYKATIEIPFGDTVKAYYGNYKGESYDFTTVVKENVNALTLKCAGSNCNYAGDIYVDSVKLLDASGNVLCPGGTGSGSDIVAGEETIIDDFSENKIGKDTYGYLWYTNPGYQYNHGVAGGAGTKEPDISWDSAKKRMKISLNYSADADKSWSEAKIALWNSEGYDISNYNCLSLEYTYPESLKDVEIKVYASNPAATEDAKVVLMDSNMDRTNETDNGDGTYTSTMILYFTPNSEVKLGSINLGFVGKNINATGAVYVDNVKVSKEKIPGSIEIDPPKPSTSADISKMPTAIKMVDKNATAQAKAIYSFLHGMVASNQVVFGHQNDNSRRVAAAESDTKDLTGSLSGLVAYDSLAVTGSELGLSTSQGLASTVASAKAAAAQGAIISLSLHMPNFATMSKNGSTDFSKYDFESSKDLSGNCAENILPGKAYNALYNSYLDIIVDFAKQLQTDNIPVILRPLHENNGGWFWWGSSTKPEVYKALYRYTVNYFKDAGVHNFIYEYSPNGPITDEAYFLSRYPGDEYVDILAFDYYSDYASKDASYDESFMGGLKSSCEVIKAIADERGKVAAIAETGVRVTKDSGDNNGLLISGNPIKGHNWYNEVNKVAQTTGMSYYLLWANFSNQNFYVPYKFDETTGHELVNEFVDFYNQPSSIFANDISLSDVYAKANSITVESYDSVSGYMIDPTDFAEVPNATKFTAQVVNATEDVIFKIDTGDGTPVSVKAVANGSTYTADITSSIMADIGATDTAVVTLESGSTVIATAKYVSFNKKKPVMPSQYLDNFEYYFGDVDYLASKYSGSNSAVGCSSSMNITSKNRKDGSYAGEFKYTLSYTGTEVYTGTGMQLTNTDFSGKDAFSFWIVPDGYGQKFIVQVVSGGKEFEADLTNFVNGTKGQYVTVPFSSFVPKISGAVFNASAVTQMYFYCNTIPANAPASIKDASGNYTINSSIYVDCMKAIDVPDNVSIPAGGYLPTDTPVDGVEDHITPDEDNVPVTGVSLNKKTLTMEINETAVLNATVTPDNATNQNIIWSVDKPSVVEVDQSGTVTAKAAGTANVTVATEDGNYKAVCTITVNAVIVEAESINLNLTEKTLNKTETCQLSATVLPEETADKTVTWSSSDETIATVSETGLVKALGKGTATITATTVNGKKATCEITVKSPVTGVTLNADEKELAVGGKITLVATVQPSEADNQSVTWSSSNPGVANVENGVITAVAAGKATITVTTVDGGKTAACEVTVITNTVPVTGITVNKPSTTLKVGQEETFTATILPANASDKNVNWSSSDETVVTVVDGIVTAKKAGEATITAASASNPDAKASIVVTVEENAVYATGIAITKPENNRIATGSSLQLNAVVTPEDAIVQDIAWNSSDETVAMVDAAGNVTGIGEGSATIIARAKGAVDNTVFDTIIITVYNPVTSVYFGKDVAESMKVGETQQLNVRVEPANATNQALNYHSSNPEVVSVNSVGEVKAVGAGTATITVTSVSDAKTAEVTITVEYALIDNPDFVNAFENVKFDPKSEWDEAKDAEGKKLEHKVSNVTTAGIPKKGFTITAKVAIPGVDGMRPDFTGELKIKVAARLGENWDYVSTENIPAISAAGLVWDSQSQCYYANIAATFEDDIEKYVDGVKQNVTKFEDAFTNAIRGVSFECAGSLCDYEGNIYIADVAIMGAEDENVAVTGVTLDKTTATLTVGETAKLTATVAPETATNRNVTWSSSDETIATVAEGMVTAKKAGKVTITVTTVDGAKKAECVVTVTAKTVPTPTPTPTPTPEKAENIIAGVNASYKKTIGSKAFTLKATGQGIISYVSSDKKVVTVDASTGKVTIKGTGKAVITITASGNAGYKAASKQVTIQVVPKKQKLVAIKSKKAKTITLKWKKDKKASGYQIQYSTNKKFKGAKTVTIKKNKIYTKTVSNLKAGRKYYVRVRAYGKSKSYGSWSKAKNITVRKVVPKKQKLVAIKSKKAKTITLKWKKDKKASGYQIQYSTNKKFKGAKTVTIKKNKIYTKTVSNLKAGRKYYVRVRAYGKSKSYGSWSKAKNITVRK